MASYLGNLLGPNSSPSSAAGPGPHSQGPIAGLTGSPGLGQPTPNMPLMGPGFGSELPKEQAVSLLQNVMRENHDLKATLRDNNLAVNSLQKVLFEMKTNWEAEREDFQNKYEMAKSVVLGLRKDVEAKKTQILSLKTQQGTATTENPPASTQKGSAQQHSSNRETDNLKIQLEQMSKRHQETSEQLKKTIAEKTEECESLQDKMSQLVQHNRKVMETNQKLTSEISAIRSQNSDLQSRVQHVESAIGPDSLALLLKDSFVIVDSEDLESPEKQTQEKMALGGRLSSGEDEKKSLAKYESEQKGEKGGAANDQEHVIGTLLVQLKAERQKVQQLEAKTQELQAMLESQTHELHIRDASLTNLKTSLDGKMLQLKTEHAEKEEQLIKEIDNMQRCMQQSQSWQSQPQTESIGNMKAQVVSLLHEVHETNRRLELSTVTARKFQQKYEEITQRYGHVQEELETQRSKDDHLIEALRSTVASTEASLATQKELNDKNGAMLEESRQEIQELKKEIGILKYQLTEQKKKSLVHSPDGTILLTLTEKRNMEEKLDNLTAQLLTMEDNLLGKQEEVQKLQQKVMLLRNENEDMPYLKAQVESYKTDFEIQRQRCADIAREKQQIMEEMEGLRLFNSQLRDQLGQLSSPTVAPSSPWERNVMRSRPYPSGGYDECDRPEGRESSPRRAPTEHSTAATNLNGPLRPDTRNEYECPKCGLKTMDIDSMTIHVEDCLQNTEGR